MQGNASHPCRGRSLNDNAGENYYLARKSNALSFRDIEECKAMCSATARWELNSRCTGIEWSPGRCELWQVMIEAVNPAVSTCGPNHGSLNRPGICQTHHFSFTMRFYWLALSSLTSQGIRVQDSDSLQRLLGSCVKPWLPDETACSARSIREMPTLIDEAVYRVEYASHPITSNGLKSLSTLLSFTHSALVITEALQVLSAEQTQASALLFEYFARDFGPKAILPASISDGGVPTWENQAVVGWRLAAEKGEWLQGANRTTVGTAKGKILNQWFREVVLWGKRHPGYNLFNLWDSTDVVTRKSYMGDSVCHSFTEWSLVDLFRLGADFSIQRPLCRNYFSFITDDSPTKLNMTTSADSQTVAEFYKSLEPLTSQSFHDIAEFASNLLSAVKGETSPESGEVVGLGGTS
ncbi:unnamed protein product [Symbiodinium sp. CCMP2456]|nr:unnamed protein product [Symbiodinium sp. CCMP2456]